MFTASSSAIGFQFEQIVADIFRIYGFNTTLTKQSHDGGYDILATKDDTRYLIEVKYSRKNYVPTSSLYDAACRLKIISDMQETPSVPILVLKMIDIKMGEGIPADYLYTKFDELLINLEK